MAFIFQQVMRFFHASNSYYYLLGLGLLLLIPSLFSGFFADDFSHAVLINNPDVIKQPDNLSLFHLFTFITEDTFRREQLQAISALPWWVNPEFKLMFFRPLAELTHYLDYQVINVAWVMHLQSLLWYGLLLFLVARLYQSFCQRHTVAVLAFLLFVVDATHGFTVAWLANRNAVMAAVFSMAAVLLHHQGYAQGEVQGSLLKRGLSVVMIICSFLSAEAGISVGIYLFFYALFLDQAGWKKGLLKLLPALLVFLTWAWVYHSYGYGALGNKAYYVNLVSMPGFFVENFIHRFPHAMAIQFNLLPLHMLGAPSWLLITIGTAAFVVLAVFVWAMQLRSLAFFFATMVVAIIPIASAEVQERNMLFVGIAAAPVLAQLMAFLWQQIKCARQRIIVILSSIVLLTLVIFHVFISALLMIPTAYAPKLVAQPAIDTALSLSDDIADKQVISLGTPLFEAGFLSSIRWAASKPLPQRFWNVSTQLKGSSVFRVDENTLEVENENGLLAGLDFLLRDKLLDPIAVGEFHQIKELSIEVLAVNDDSVPIRLRVVAEQSLDNEQIHIVYWQDRTLKSLQLNIGERRVF